MSAVEVARFHEPQDADLAAAFLASHGVDAFVADRHISTIDPLMRLAVGGIRVMAAPADADRARDLLARADRGEFASDTEAPAGSHASPALTAGVLAATVLTGGVGGLALTAARRRLSAIQITGFVLIAFILLATLALYLGARI